MFGISVTITLYHHTLQIGAKATPRLTTGFQVQNLGADGVIANVCQSVHWLAGGQTDRQADKQTSFFRLKQTESTPVNVVSKRASRTRAERSQPFCSLVNKSGSTQYITDTQYIGLRDVFQLAVMALRTSPPSTRLSVCLSMSDVICTVVSEVESNDKNIIQIDTAMQCNSFTLLFFLTNRLK